MWLKLSTFEGLEPLVLVSEVGYHAIEPKMRELPRKKLWIFKVLLYCDEMTSFFPFSVSQNSPIDTAAKFVQSSVKYNGHVVKNCSAQALRKGS